MTTAFRFKLEEIELRKRHSFLSERLRLEGPTQEVMAEISRLNEDTHDLYERVENEVKKIELAKNC